MAFPVIELNNVQAQKDWHVFQINVFAIIIISSKKLLFGGVFYSSKSFLKFFFLYSFDLYLAIVNQNIVYLFETNTRVL
jgi:hypothetical protein